MLKKGGQSIERGVHLDSNWDRISWRCWCRLSAASFWPRASARSSSWMVKSAEEEKQTKKKPPTQMKLTEHFQTVEWKIQLGSFISYTLYQLYYNPHQSFHLGLGFLLQLYHLFHLDHGRLLLSCGISTHARQTASETSTFGYAGSHPGHSTGSFMYLTQRQLGLEERW